MLETLANVNLQPLTKTLALAAAGVVIAFVASNASAAECVNGLRTIESGLVFQCEGGPAFGASAFTDVDVTGSIPAGGALIAPVPVPEAPESRSLLVDNPTECVPGGYWYMEHDSSYTVMAC